MPITSSGLAHAASIERLPTGIPDLDQMLEGKGYYKGSSILVSGMAGTGKSTVAAHFADATCAAGDPCIYFAMEESPGQVTRNMRSVGIDLQKWVERKLLRFSARRPSLFGLETHLATMYRDVTDFDPTAVVIDPMSALLSAGATGDVHSLVLRLVDFLKSRGITTLFTDLGAVSGENATTEIQISSLMDAWLLLYNRESNGEHNRQLYLLKSRGMTRSNQVREFIMSSEGIKLRAVYVGPEGVVTGSARTFRCRRRSSQRECNRAACDLLRAGKFAEQLARCLEVGRVGGLRGPEHTKVNAFSLADDCSAPVPRSAAEGGALVSGGVVPGTTRVRVVLRPGRPAQIVPAVVAGISVAVIDHRPAPSAGHVEPRQLRCGIEAIIEADKETPLPRRVTTRWRAAEDAFGSSLAPAKLSGFRIVMQQLAQARAGQSRTSFHGGLANEKGPRSGPWGRWDRELARIKRRRLSPKDGGRERRR